MSCAGLTPVTPAEACGQACWGAGPNDAAGGPRGACACFAIAHGCVTIARVHFTIAHGCFAITRVSFAIACVHFAIAHGRFAVARVLHHRLCGLSHHSWGLHHRSCALPDRWHSAEPPEPVAGGLPGVPGRGGTLAGGSCLAGHRGSAPREAERDKIGAPSSFLSFLPPSPPRGAPGREEPSTPRF